MLARIDLRVEIVDGPDAGYVLQESNKLVDLIQLSHDLRPYRVTVEFVTPGLMREWHNIMENKNHDN